jgi:hypothetical protein
MGDPFPAEHPFFVDGTGQIVRPGDEVIVAARTLSSPSGHGTVAGVLGGDYALVRFGADAAVAVHVNSIHRADDAERTPAGLPLWSWM